MGKKKHIKAILKKYMTRFNVPGAVVGYKKKDGHVVLVSMGVGNLDDQNPVSANWVWPLRSLSKTMAVDILYSVLKCPCDLDNRLNTYLNYIPDQYKDVTMGQLANMKSGIPDYLQNSEFISELLNNPLRKWTLHELNNFGFALPQEFKPGTNAQYSNTNSNIIGEAMEIQTGKSYKALFESYIVKKFRLYDTKYARDYEDWALPHATGYTYNKGDITPALKVSFTGFGASGAVISTISDTLDWIKAWILGSHLSQKCSDIRYKMDQLSSGPEYDFYGSGLGEIGGWYGHTGQGLGFTSIAMHNIEKDQSIVIFMNISDAPRHIPKLVFRQLIKKL